MKTFSLIISIVPHDKGEKLTKAAVEAGSGGGSVLMGRGLASSNFGAILGTGETTKDLTTAVTAKRQSENSSKNIQKSSRSSQNAAAA